MYGVSSENPDVPCLHCRRIMVDLASLNEAADRDAVANSDGFQYDSFRNRHAAGVFLFFDALDWIMDICFAVGRRRKIKRLCQTVLPEWPRSLICGNCLFVFRRK